MKKILLTTTFLISGAIGLLAQGLVSFVNDPSLGFLANESDYLIYLSPGVPLSDSSYSAQLFEVSTPYTGFRGAAMAFGGSSPAPGVWDYYSDAAEGARSLGPKGTATQLQVVILQGVTEVKRGDLFSFTPPNDPAAADAFFMKNFRGFVVPEPSTVALGVLGLSALLLFRRRK